MNKVRTNIYLTPDIVGFCADLAEKCGISGAELIRRVITRYLSKRYPSINFNKQEAIVEKKYKVEKKIPIPQGREQGAKGDVLKKMNVGDSIKVESYGIATGFYAAGRLIGLKVTVREIGSTGKYRVWRAK